MTSNVSPYTHDELVKSAVAIYDYSFGNHDIEALNECMNEIYSSAQQDGRAPQNSTSAQSEEYRLNSAAISHLDDCYTLVQTVRVPLIVIAALAVAALAHVGVRCGRRHVGRALLCAGSLTLALFLVAGAAALIDFNAFFSFFHGLFFPQGNWTFWYRSLLICSLPEGFWMGMGIIWLATTVLISILSCGIGAALVRKKPRKHTKEA